MQGLNRRKQREQSGKECLFRKSCWSGKKSRSEVLRQFKGPAYLRSLCYLLFNLFSAITVGCLTLKAQGAPPAFKVLAFYTGKSDQAHISFVREANRWFATNSRQANFSYESTTNWADLNDEVLAQYQVVLFLDTRPDGTDREIHSVNIWKMAAPGWDFILQVLH